MEQAISDSMAWPESVASSLGLAPSTISSTEMGGPINGRCAFVLGRYPLPPA